MFRGLFQRHVDTVAGKDELKSSDRFGNVAGVLSGFIALSFFLIHRGRPTGFFTEDFGALAAFLLFAPQILVLLHMAGQAIVGRQNVLRPLEAGNQALSLVSVAYLFTLFPFDFSHFADPLPRFLEFTISWINDGIAKFIMVIMIIVFGALSIYTPLLYIHVKRALDRRNSGI